MARERSAELFEQLMRGRIAGVALVAADGSFLRVNPALCAFLDRTPDQLRAATWQELTHPDDVEADMTLLREVVRGTRDEYRLHKRYVRPTGEVMWGDLSVSCLRNDDRSIYCFVSQILDVTQLVRAQEQLAAREEHYRLVVEASDDVLMMNGLDGTIHWISPNVSRMTGYTAEEVVGRNALDLFVHTAERDRMQEAMVTAIRREDPTTTVFRVHTKGGGSLWVEAAGQTARSATGSPTRIVRWRNVDAEHRALEQLRDSERLFRTAMAASATGMATLTLDRAFTRVNEAFSRMVDREEQWLLHHGIGDLLDPADDAEDRAVRARLRSGERVSASIDKRLLRPHGEAIEVRHGIGILRDDEGQPTGYVSQFVDITEVNRARKAMEFLAAHDPLTKVRNRRGLMTELESVLSHPQRTGARIGVAYIDLDGFKPLNDRHGHLFGDQVLEEIASRLRSALRGDDLVGRFGGDEFVIVLLGLHGGSELRPLLDSIRGRIAQPMAMAGKSVNVTASLGMTLAAENETAADLLARADAALYQSKQAGGNTVTIV